MLLLAIIFLTAHCFAAWQEVGNVTVVTPSKTNGMILGTTSRAKVLIEFFDLDVIRVRVTPTGTFERD